MAAPFSISRRAGLALFLGAVLGFLAIALYSPLHQHGPDGSCSLNGIEFLAQAQSDSGVSVVGLSPLAWRETPTSPLHRSMECVALPQLRGPPFLG